MKQPNDLKRPNSWTPKKKSGTLRHPLACKEVNDGLVFSDGAVYIGFLRKNWRTKRPSLQLVRAKSEDGSLVYGTPKFTVGGERSSA